MHSQADCMRCAGMQAAAVAVPVVSGYLTQCLAASRCEPGPMSLPLRIATMQQHAASHKFRT